MPKIILNLRENILKESKKILKTEGYEKLTVRRVAKLCGVAVGTVYNYFPSKEMLTAGVMLDDWNRSLGDMRKAALAAPSPMKGLEEICTLIRRFVGEYTETWEQYRSRGVNNAQSPYRHHILVAQIAEAVSVLLERFGGVFCEQLPAFLAENLLILASGSEEDMAKAAPIFEKLLAKTE